MTALLNQRIPLARGRAPGRPPAPRDTPAVLVPMQRVFDPAIYTGYSKAADTNDYTLGVVLEVAVDGLFSKVMMYKPAGSPQTGRTVGLYTTTGRLLVSGTVTEEAEDGWIEVDLYGPYWFPAGSRVVAASTVIGGSYGVIPFGFDTEVVSGDIRAIADAEDAIGNGRLIGFTGLRYPNETFNNGNYLVDAGFTPGTKPPLPTGYAETAGVEPGHTLTEYTGPMTVTEAGTLIEDKIINGSLVITADNVTVRNCQVNFTFAYGIDAGDRTGTVITHCTITGPGASGVTNAGILSSGTITYNDVSLCENGIVLTSGGSTVRFNRIHDLLVDKAEPHYDGITAQGGQNGVLIEKNHITARDTSGIFLKNDFGAIAAIIINDNLLDGDPGNQIVVDARGVGGAITDITITANKMLIGAFDYVSFESVTPTYTGNTNLMTGQPI